MPEIFRSRDLIVFAKGNTMTVTADSAMTSAGWPGGQGVMWVDASVDDRVVTFSDGERGAGFALWGADETSDKFTGLTLAQPTYQCLTFGRGSWLISTTSYERFTLASGRTVPIVYNPGDHLRFGLRGLWTKEDEWTVTGDPRAPNLNFTGQVTQVPSASNQFYLGIQTTL